ncbi:MAG: RNA methyltransferase [Thermoanaerobaculia bacterium]
MAPSPLGIVLVRPHSSANLGSAARAARNFGVEDLRLVEPAAPVDDEARRLASGADGVLDRLRRFTGLSDAVAEFDAVVATSSLRGREEQRFLALEELPRFLAELGEGARVAFVFGPERSGLTEEERSRASACLRLPARADFPTLNLSHAIAVVLAVASLPALPRAAPEQPWAPAADVEGAMGHWDRALEAIGFYDTGHRERSLRDWRRIVAGRPLSRREVAILRGVANRVLVALKRKSAVDRQQSTGEDS